MLAKVKSSIFSFKKIANTILFDSDTTMIRVALAISSLLTSVLYMSHDNVFYWKTCSVMLKIANGNVWAALFLLHAFAAFWRLVDPAKRVLAALVVNSFGLSLWLITTLSALLSSHAFSPLITLSLVFCGFGAWVVVRTGIREELFTP